MILCAPQVSQEKSKEGLGDIYEREYMRLALGVEGESAESKDKQEMAALFRKLCHVSQYFCNTHDESILCGIIPRMTPLLWRSTDVPHSLVVGRNWTR